MIDLAQTDKTPKITSIVSESFPHLKRGAMRDFLNIMQSSGYYQDAGWNQTDSVYEFPTGSKIEFFSADQPSKVRGPRRDRLFLNEANNVPYETFDQLEVRTKDMIYLDWNPTNEFWWHTVVAKRDDTEQIILTYKDNEALDPQIVASIEQRRSNANWWRVYGEGRLGMTEGSIYTGWQEIEDIPHEARLIRVGLDFGYTNDPTAILAVYRFNGGYILDEVTYLKGLQNKPIADVLLNFNKTVMVKADSAEPKSIDEIRSYGVNIYPSKKGQGSIQQGISFIQDQRISVTKRSFNIWKEYRNYLWKKDRDGRFTNDPEGGFDHMMDALRYALEDFYLQTKEEDKPKESILSSLNQEEDMLYPDIGL